MTISLQHLALGLSLAVAPAAVYGQVTTDVPAANPVAIVNLATVEGAELAGAAWQYRDARVIEVDHRHPGPDLRASGAPNRTNDLSPRPGTPGFDGPGWQAIRPTELIQRRTNGRLSFGWYRTSVTIPARIGSLDPTGLKVVFELVLDDYAEIWVNGRLPVTLGQAGGQLVKGFNTPNRVLLTDNARPGDRYDIAILGINGPLSSPPANFVWIRSATLDFHRSAMAPGVGEIVRLDPRLDRLVAKDATIERLASGFQFTEGPVWVNDPGYLLFSDPNANTIYRWSPDGQVSVYRTKSGYSGVDVGQYRQPGSNGLTLDREGRVTINEHGNRRVTRIERNGTVTVLADRFGEKRLNSPNDLIYKSDGSLYFTDPPFGLPRVFDDAMKEQPFSGIYRLRDGVLALLASELTGPNGIAFSPDERFLYVGNWDVARKVIMRYEVRPDGSLANGRVFYDATSAPGDEAWDGIKVDELGNLYAAGPGGIFVLSPEGTLLGMIKTPEHAANAAWGDADGRTLYITATSGLYRLRMNVQGIRPTPSIEAAAR